MKNGVKKMQNAAYNGARTEFSLRTNLLVKKDAHPPLPAPIWCHTIVLIQSLGSERSKVLEGNESLALLSSLCHHVNYRDVITEIF